MGGLCRQKVVRRGIAFPYKQTGINHKQGHTCASGVAPSAAAHAHSVLLHLSLYGPLDCAVPVLNLAMLFVSGPEGTCMIGHSDPACIVSAFCIVVEAQLVATKNCVPGG